jgi:phosphate-selective porin OprO/OprP
VTSASAQQSAQELQAIQAQIQQMQESNRQMQATIKALQKQVQDAQAQAGAAQAAAESGGMSDLDLKVKWKGAPEFSSADGKKFKFKVRGRIMADYNGIDQDEPITDEGDISAVELRRARLGVEGVIFYDWKYKFEVDFAAHEVAIKDAYIAWANWGPESWEMSEIRVGNQYTYNSLEQITSSRFITFMERAAFTEAFFLDRQIGGAVLIGGEHWSLQSGYYGAVPGNNAQGDNFGQEEFDIDQTAVTVRGTVAPLNREVNGVNQVVHLGASYRHRDAGELNDETTDFYEYRARNSDLHLADRLVDTPKIFERDDMFVLEAAFVWGSFSMQGEYAQLEGDIPTSFFAPGTRGVDPTYEGWYVDASWYITGETRNYEASEGIFGRTKVKRPVFDGSGGHGWGAWQIAGRYDVINLGDDAALIPGCGECGDQETWLIGLNWLLTDYTAIKLNVTQSNITGGNNAPRGSGSGFNRNDGAETTGVGARFQVDW